LRIRDALSRLVVSLIFLPVAGCALSFRVDPIDFEAQNSRGWSRVTTLPKTSDVIVTRESGAPASRTFGAASESELITLNLASPTLPRPVKRTLSDLASERQPDLFRVSYGDRFTDGRVRFEGGGIFLDGSKVAAIDQVLERTPKSRVSEVRRVHRNTRRGLMWGFIAGAGLGLAVTLSSCGTNWSQETSSCSNLTPLWVFIGPSYGALIGTGIGAASRTSTVVYTTR
jgi:hypothetical protein